MALIEYELDENQILNVFLSNVSVANAYSPNVNEEFNKLIEEFQNKNVKGLVLSSAGEKYFCSGGNLKAYADMTEDEGLLANRKIRHTLERLYNWPIAKVCVVNGDVFGGGVELASCFNKVLMTSHSLMGLWQRRIALTYGWGGENRLLKRVSRAILEDLMLSGRTISAYRACELGLVDSVCSENTVLKTATSWIHSQMALSQVAGKSIFNLRSSNEEEVFEKLWHNDDHKEVLERFKK